MPSIVKMMKWPDSDWSQAHVGGNVIRGKATTLQKTSMTDLCYWLLRAAQRQVTRVHYGKVRAISGKKFCYGFPVAVRMHGVDGL